MSDLSWRTPAVSAKAEHQKEVAKISERRSMMAKWITKVFENECQVMASEVLGEVRRVEQRLLLQAFSELHDTLYHRRIGYEQTQPYSTSFLDL
jgi:hypothetical protein